MNDEVQLYSDRLRHVLDKLVGAVGGLDEAALNWRPDARDVNSVYVIATHTMGNLEAWVLGIACGQPVDRDRQAEFASSGGDTAALVARAHELRERFDAALAELPKGELDAVREPAQAHWGIGEVAPLSVRAALAETIEHAYTHLGQLQVTRDLALAQPRARLPRL